MPCYSPNSTAPGNFAEPTVSGEDLKQPPFPVSSRAAAVRGQRILSAFAALCVALMPSDIRAMMPFLAHVTTMLMARLHGRL